MNISIYIGTRLWGWRLFGISYKNAWFIGLSMRADSATERKS